MTTKNPNNLLAVEISKKLIKEELIDKSSEQQFIKCLSQGTFKDTDWKKLLETVINKPKSKS